jgi:uncharacterized protein YdeI (YjbR/CyaY-like superfamily)
MALEIGEIFYPPNRDSWRGWLFEYHQEKPEIWLQKFKKASGMPAISYDDLVEECLCFGWIDSVIKKWDADSNVQRITPRREKSFLSELNRQRAWKLLHQGLMTDHGFDSLGESVGDPDDPFEMAPWVLEQLKADPMAWRFFRTTPRLYQRLKMAWITEPRGNRQDERQRRLSHLIKMCAQGKRYGTEPLRGVLYEMAAGSGGVE